MRPVFPVFHSFVEQNVLHVPTPRLFQRVPLNPWLPAVPHEIVLPAGSVIVTCVLLNVDWMCTTPVEMFLRTRFFPRA